MEMQNEMFLVQPTAKHLASYIAALERGYAPSTTREESRFEDLRKIEVSPETFLSDLYDPEAKAGPVRLQDGSLVPRIPSFIRWMWDGEFAGSISLRWLPGTGDLPPTCMGHIGYSVVSWKRGRGYAKSALALILPQALGLGLPYVDIVTNPDNIASQRVVLANRGVLIERFLCGPENGGEEALRFRIVL
jgi:predicted acetyltransferase